MASTSLGTIRIGGQVIVRWDNGQETIIGQVETDVEVSIPDNAGTRLEKNWTPS